MLKSNRSKEPRGVNFRKRGSYANSWKASECLPKAKEVGERPYERG